MLFKIPFLNSKQPVSETQAEAPDESLTLLSSEASAGSLPESPAEPEGSPMRSPDSDGFVIPEPIADPQTADEAFFNMRLQFFLPEGEPLIKETFGAVLSLEDEGFWEYESPYSRAVAFATNLPVLALIEYGTDTAYGMRTSQSVSYFYRHVCYLTGLEPGTTYHYRIRAKGSDGQLLVSEDHVFTAPLVSAGVIRVPEDLPDPSLPYKLTTPNAKYLLTRDIQAPNGGIVMKAHNIELDLGGHTIIYDNEPNPIMNEHLAVNTDGSPNPTKLLYSEEATFGVRSGIWNLRNHKVFNGTIIQGANGGSGIYGYGYNPVWLGPVADTEVGGVTVDYYGDNMSGISVSPSSYIHHNVVNDRGTGVDNRGEQMRAIRCSLQAGNVTEYNSVRRCRQTGITTGGSIRGNEIYDDSFAANSFLIAYDSGSVISGNRLFGLGYNPIGIGSYDMSNAVARNNFLYLHAYAPEQRDEEYDRVAGAAGFRPQLYDDWNYKGPGAYNNLFENNVVSCKAWDNSSYVRALWIRSSIFAENLQVNNNLIRVESMSETIDPNDVQYCFACVDLQGFSEYEEPPEILLKGNTFQTNAHFLVVGTAYGMGSHAFFYNNTFEKINHHDSFFWPVRMGYWNNCSTGNKLIDSAVGPGVDLSLPPLKGSVHTEPLLNLAVGVSSQRAYMDASTGSVLANREITWRLDGGGEGSFITDSLGEASTEWVTTWSEHKPGEPGTVMSQIHNTTVTFTTAGFEPVTAAIADIRGAGPAIVFGQAVTADLMATGLAGGPAGNANTMALFFWCGGNYTGAEIYRSEAGHGPFQLVKTEQGKPYYYDGGLKPDTAYYYKFRLLHEAPGGEVTYGPLTEALALRTSDVTAYHLTGGPTGNANNMGIYLLSHSEYDSVEIHRSMALDGPYQLVKTEYGKPYYYDAGLLPSTTYYYRVRLSQGEHFGPLSEAVALTTSDVTAIYFRGQADAGAISLSWWPLSDYDYAEIHRSEAEGAFVLLGRANEWPYADTAIVPGTVYSYTIRLVQNGHIGPFSEAIQITAQ